MEKIFIMISFFFSREMILQLRENTKASLEAENDPATVLHLASTMLFYHSTGLILNAPGRCVPNILEFLKDRIQADVHAKLVHFQSKLFNPFSSLIFTFTL
jgi:hypothetical protein